MIAKICGIFHLTFKVGLSPSKKVFFISFIESPLKIMKNAFSFILTTLFVLEIFDVGNSLIKKLRLISKFMTSQTGQTIIKIHTLLNFSKSIDNQVMKFGQLIEYNMRNTFLQKWYTKWGGEDPFTKIQKWAYFWINDLKCYKVYSSWMTKSRSTKIY